MQEISKLTADSILEDDILCEVFEQEDEIYKAKLLLTLTDRAKELGVKTKFETMVKAYKKERAKYDKANKPEIINPNTLDRLTEFIGKYDQMRCGNWIANDHGIRTYNMLGGEILACYHPILPIQRLINAETGKEKIKLAFKKGGRWKEIIVDKNMIVVPSQIVKLAEYGISVIGGKSGNSDNLVRYLADIENMNIDCIDTQISTSKFGWIEDEFIPYSGNVIFDSESKFKEIYESVCEYGDIDQWMNLIKKIRRGNRMEPRIYMAGSFASVLLKPFNMLPFILNLWSETGKGKTVAIMIATSIWANPGESKYITDPYSKPTALEVRNDILNNLPLVIDDLSKMRDKYGEDFSDIIYMLCGGKGKDRSNINLGLNRSMTWCNVVLTNIERPLATETMKGGAINRILDFEMEDGSVFENGNAVVETINQNYGFAGRLFIDAIQEIGMDHVREIQQDFLRQINDKAKETGVEKEEKQTMPLSIMLTADKIATDYIFHDSIYLDFDRCFDTLKSKGEVSENERAYEFILSEVAVNMNKFKPDSFTGEYRNEIWGSIENGYVYILSNAFNRICERGNFSGKAFLSWAAKQGFIEGQNGKNTKPKRLNGSLSRCVCLRIPEENVDKDGFISLSEYDQEQLPFN